MRRVYSSALLVAAVALIPGLVSAQDAEKSNAVAGGGITAKGWMGKVDGKEATAGMTINNAKFEKSAKGDTLHVITGPASTYWNPANKATGNYTVSATFTEPQFMGRNDHAHPYGIVIAANAMDKDDTQSYLYCAAYGDGRFIVRGFGGPKVFNMNGRGGPNDAIHKVEKGKPVTQDIAMTVSASSVDCAINGTVVATFPKDSLVQAGRLSTTDGTYGVRFAHNTEGFVTNLKMVKK